MRHEQVGMQCPSAGLRSPIYLPASQHPQKLTACGPLYAMPAYPMPMLCRTDCRPCSSTSSPAFKERQVGQWQHAWVGVGGPSEDMRYAMRSSTAA
jgi:hypothetical protein